MNYICEDCGKEVDLVKEYESLFVCEDCFRDRVETVELLATANQEVLYGR